MNEEKERYFIMFIIEKDLDKVLLFLNDETFKIKDNSAIEKALLYSSEEIIDSLLSSDKIIKFLDYKILDLPLIPIRKEKVIKTIKIKNIYKNINEF